MKWFPRLALMMNTGRTASEGSEALLRLNQKFTEGNLGTRTGALFSTKLYLGSVLFWIGCG